MDRTLARFRSPEAVFTEIYTRNQWGGKPGEICSGGGSSDSLADAYVAMIASRATAGGYSGMTFVDLGCGDMRVGRRLIPLCKSYIGADVVKYVVDAHRKELCSANVRFLHLDIVRDELPDGDVCFIRQVFQHLSNEQILAVLPKLRKYREVYITEHLPSAGRGGAPNLDKPHGKGIRLDRNSGVDITFRPFNVPAAEVTAVLEVRGNDVAGDADPGVIRTVLLTPRR